MIGSIAHLEKNLNIRAGKHLLMLKCCIAATALLIIDARTITLQPFERNMLHPIEKQSWWLTLVLIQ
jgi:ribosome recycling factor